jgi:hypothetical protein
MFLGSRARLVCRADNLITTYVSRLLGLHGLLWGYLYFTFNRMFYCLTCFDLTWSSSKGKSTALKCTLNVLMKCTGLAVLYIWAYLYEIWGLHGDENSEHDILGSDIMQSSRWVQMQRVPETIHIFNDMTNFKPRYVLLFFNGEFRSHPQQFYKFTTNHFPISKY